MRGVAGGRAWSTPKRPLERTRDSCAHTFDAPERGFVLGAGLARLPSPPAVPREAAGLGRESPGSLPGPVGSAKVRARGRGHILSHAHNTADNYAAQRQLAKAAKVCIR